MKFMEYKELEIVTSPKKRYWLSPEIYSKNNLKVLITPFSRRLVIFKYDNKVTDHKEIKKIIDKNYEEIKCNKANNDKSSQEALKLFMDINVNF